MGPLMRSIFRDAAPYAGKGTAHSSMFATSLNEADAKPLIGGEAIFSAMGKLIEGAKREIFLSSYEWDSQTKSAGYIFNGLKDLETRLRGQERSGHPVDVWIQVDERSKIARRVIQSKTTPKASLDEGIAALHLDPNLVRVHTGAHRHLGLGSNHSKYLVIDQERAVATGANVQRANDVESRFDLGFVLAGEVARSIASDFQRSWKEGAGPSFQPEAPRSDDHATRARVPMLTLTRPPNGNPLDRTNRNPQNQALLAAFRHASERIRIITPNLNDAHVKSALVEAVRRGVKVEVLLSKGFNDRTEGMPFQGGTNEAVVEQLRAMLRADKGSDPASRLEVRWFSQDGKSPVETSGPTASHAKYLSVDSQVVFVGGTNMDTQSWHHSQELGILIDSAELARSWDEAVFDPVFQKGVLAK
jgi:phosphatidylserine/phosphatidylglycerophosphate/cardiolipin synthase-like enzyme